MSVVRAAQRVRWIAQVTFLEAAREKFFNVLLLVSFGFVAGALFFLQFNFGGPELRFVVDLGGGVTLFFGSILAIVLPAQHFFAELDNRTALTVLARPIQRGEFILGKFLGVGGLLFAFVLVITLTLGLLLLLRENLLAGGLEGRGAEAGGVRYLDLFPFALLQGLRLGVVAALCLFIGSFSSSQMYCVTVSFLALVICQLQHVAQEAYGADTAWPLLALVRAIGWIMPNLQVFQVTGLLIVGEGEGPPPLLLARVGLFGLLYIGVFLGLAVGFFRDREV